MTKKIFFLLFCCSYFVQGQYTEIINANRPGFSQSPYAVGTGVYQFEGNLFFRKADASETFSNPQAWGLNLDFRTSLLEEDLEIIFNTSLQQDKIAFKNVFESSYNKFGLGQFTLGAKYLAFAPKYTDKGKEIRSWTKRHAFDSKRWIPHISAYAGINFGSFLNTPYKHGGITPKVGILLLNEFSNQFNLVSNVYYNYIGSDYPEWSYVVTGTYNFNDTWAGFAEHQAKFNTLEKTSNVGCGLAYLYSNDLQFNTSLRATFQESGVGVYASLGASYRLDRHQDKFIELDEFGNKIEEEEKQTYNKGFFGRLIDKIIRIFKKKDKNKPEIDEEFSKDKPVDEEENTGGRKRKKSVLDDIIKGDKKAKKKKTKAEEKAERKAKKAEEKIQRKAKKAEEKAQREAEKELRKEEKRKQKEQEKLAREVEKLEKELKKDEQKEQEEQLQEKYEKEKKKQKEQEKKKKEAEKKKKND